MKFNTSTIDNQSQIVPWLAAKGPLSYTPENPPNRDYYFQYSWIIPDVLSPKTNRRRHFFFGEWQREDSHDLFSFWNKARSGTVQRIQYCSGSWNDITISAPIAIYEHRRDHSSKKIYVFIQHGSYQLVPKKEQPLIDEGWITLYRGIQKKTVFSFPTFKSDDLSFSEKQFWKCYIHTQKEILSNSILSFNAIHDRAVRCETEHLNDRTLVSDQIALKNGLFIEKDAFSKSTWEASQQSFSLSKWIAQKKFGPNYVICKTTIDNIRLTTFLANEYEVKIIDPNKVVITKTIGCSA